jgi:hypothetical protein
MIVMLRESHHHLLTDAKGEKVLRHPSVSPLILLAHTSHMDVFLSIVDDGELLGAFTFLGYAFF